jgi:hypothetical protein
MMSDARVVLGDELMSPYRQADVIEAIRRIPAADGWKRSLYLRWLLAVGIAYESGDLDDVITNRPRLNAPTEGHA